MSQNNKPPFIKAMKFCGLRKLTPLLGDRDLDRTFNLWRDHVKDYELKKINIITGRNGAGKSTVLQLIDFIRDPSILSSIARENRTDDSHSGFLLKFSNEIILEGEFYPIARPDYPNAESFKNYIQGQATRIKVYTSRSGTPPAMKLGAFYKNISKIALDDKSLKEIRTVCSATGAFVSLWDQDTPISNHDLVDALNKAAPLLCGLASTADPADPFYRKDGLGERHFHWIRENPFHIVEADPERIGVWLSDDLGQSNRVHISALPSGWRKLASILCWLNGKEVPENSICLIEEPEVHMHPHLERHLAKEMAKIIKNKNLQIFITTHSPAFQNAAIWDENKDEVQFFEATGDALERGVNKWRLLDVLGVKNSDIAQSNGIIWVEGPSDRIYIKHWLSVWCKKNGKNIPKENIDYSFGYYGGAVLSHYSIDDESEDLIDLLRINRNFVMVMDNDNDFIDEEELKGRDGSKNRIIEMINRVYPDSLLWVTNGYTIESYLEIDFRKKYFHEYSDGRISPKCGKKVRVARVYVNLHKDYESIEGTMKLVDEKIHAIHQSVAKWNYRFD